MIIRSESGRLKGPGSPALLAMGAVTVLAWAAVLFGPTGMEGGLAVFLAAWTLMMVAMMLPSAAPLVLLYRRGATARATVALATGYLLVWAATGLPVWVAMGVVPLWAGPAVLALAGAYQFTPFKAACLTRCRTPADFLVQRWGRSALRLGVEHGAWCVGCCWALMLVLVFAGMMGLAWVAGVTAIVALEKLHPRGQTLSRWTGALLLAGAVVQGVWLWLRASASMPMPGM